MTSCPKCETQLHDGTVRCPLCGMPLELRKFRPDPARPDPVLDPLLDRFERDEPVHFCPDCLNEFAPGQKQCRKCSVPLARSVRSAYEGSLQERPVWELGQRVAQGPPAVPRDLVRVRVAQGLEEAKVCLEELRFVGVEAYPGSDSLDPFDDHDAVGIYVRPGDREAASYLVTGLRPDDPLTRPASEELSARDHIVETAKGYLAFGKFRDARRWLAVLEDDGEAKVLAVRALLLGGDVRAAEREARQAAAVVAEDRFRGRLLAMAGLIAALAPDGAPFGKGANLPAAASDLEKAVTLTPRLAEAGKTRVDVLEALGRDVDVAAELRRLDTLNPNLLSRDGPYRRLRDTGRS